MTTGSRVAVGFVTAGVVAWPLGAFAFGSFTDFEGFTTGQSVDQPGLR